MIRYCATALISGLIAVTAANAQSYFTAGTLYKTCLQGEGSKSDAICEAYITGFANGVYSQRASTRGGHPVCVPIRAEGVRLAVQQYMKAHPELLDKPAIAVVGLALSFAFPCASPN